MCIITISINYNIKNIHIFINSLVKTNYSENVVIFTDIDYHIKTKKRFSLYKIKISRKWPFILKNSSIYNKKSEFILPCNITKYKWAIYRYGIYYHFLKKYFTYFSKVFLLDLRDSIFQLNPQRINIKDGIYICEDARYPFTIENDKWNKRWILPFYNLSDDIFRNVPLNGGSIYGNSYKIYKFLYQFNSYLKKFYIKTSDQGMINLIFYKKKIKNLNVYINHNNDGYIFTMGIELTFKNIFPNCCYLLDKHYIRRNDNTLPFIVHQYDRDKYLKNIIQSYYLNEVS